MNTRKLLLTAITFSAICGNAAAMPNLVVNGGFEGNDFGSSFVTLPPAPTGWTIDSGTIDGIGGYWQAAEGKNSIDIFGNSRGKISQTINTTVGQTYEVSYYQSYNPDFNDPSLQLILGIDSSNLGSISFNQGLTFSSTHSLTNMQWELVSTTFIAQDAQTVISFRGASEANNEFYGPALDGVSVAAVPLPGVLGLILAGLVGIGFSSKRREQSIAK